jgi:hypothetical protein
VVKNSDTKEKDKFESSESERLINSKETYVRVQLREVVVVDEVDS